jgi:hypothetical protein
MRKDTMDKIENCLSQLDLLKVAWDKYKADNPSEFELPINASGCFIMSDPIDILRMSLKDIRKGFVGLLVDLSEVQTKLINSGGSNDY